MATLQIFLVALCFEIIDGGGINADRHAFLGLRDGELGAIKALVFFGHLIEVDLQTRGDLADGYGDAAGAKIVAYFDFASEFGFAKEALNFAFSGWVAFLHLGRVFQSGIGMFLGGTSCPPDAITTRASADK